MAEPKRWPGRVALVVAKKELLDLVRDWRTLVALVLIPLILLPILFIALPMFLEGEIEELDSVHLNVVVQLAEGDDFPEALDTRLGEANISLQFELLDPTQDNLSEPGEDEDRLRLAVRNGSIHAILRLKVSATNSTESWNYAILHDSTSELSREARGRLLESVGEWEEEIMESNLAEVGLTIEEATDPISWDGDFKAADVSTAAESAGFVLSMLIPLLIAVWSASAAMQPSIDLTAGERERGTMESLLCTAATRKELLFGKWLAVATIGTGAVLLQITIFLAAFSFLLPAGFFGIPELGAVSILSLVLSVILFATSVVAIELALAVRARSVKEAGTTLAPLLMAFIAPALFAQFVNLEGIELWWFAAPVFNVCLAMREALLGINDPVHIAIWASTSVMYAVLAVSWASKQFNREDLVESIN